MLASEAINAIRFRINHNAINPLILSPLFNASAAYKDI